MRDDEPLKSVGGDGYGSVESDGSLIASRRRGSGYAVLKDEEAPVNGAPSDELSLTTFEIILLLIGAIGSIVLGAMPLAFYFFFGSMLSDLSDILYTIDIMSEGMAAINQEIGDQVIQTSYRFFIIAGVAGIGALLQLIPLVYVGERIASRLRLALFRSIVIQDIGWFDTTDTGKLTSHLSEDCIKVKDAFGEKLGQSLQAMTQCIGGLSFALYKSWSMSLIMLGMTPVIAIPIVVQATQLRAFTTEMSTASSEAMTAATETISGIRTVRAFSMGDAAVRRFNESLEKLNTIAARKSRIQGVSMSFVQISIWSACAVAFMYGGHLIQQNNGFDVGDLVTVFGMMLFTCIGLSQAMAILPEFAKAAASHAIIKQIVSQTPAIPPHGGMPLSDQSTKGYVTFQNVGFAYPTRPDVHVMDDVSFEAHPGTVVALVGESGSGKTTTFNLLERFYDPMSGTVMIDGRDIREFDPPSLRRVMSIVSQEPVLFAATIRENILFGNPDASFDDVIAAAKIANAHNFITSLPDGYETWVGERGIQLSGGQKQRVAIARAVIRNPRVLLLDEATSALDTESERLVQEALENIMVGRTSLVIAHRLATVIRSDQILVMQRGKLVGRGTHASLIESNEVYRQLALRQLSMDDKPKDKEKSEIEE